MLSPSSPSPALSREEQEELARSKKKVKDVNHAEFNDSRGSGPSSPTHLQGIWNRGNSFKDMLMGEIPGAFTQAFNFGDHMEDDAEADDEVEGLKEGLVAVKFSKEFKQHIRSPWARSLIVKVYGRSVGFNYIQSSLLALWKPAGRLDCVDLGHGFFLTRLSLLEDYEAVLKKGPWFIGGHFLSIRPWEPDFRPASANVSSIAMWIRLNELPIEYYNAEALCQIGKAIGNVLRVDTHTASETRGRFARLCVQVDVTKPLVTAILIGKFEQRVCYEGIQKLCFDCGRLGHKSASCSYSIRQAAASKETERSASGEDDMQSRNPCGSDATEAVEGPSTIVHESAQKDGQGDVQDSTYGPWVVVMRRKSETRNQRDIRGPPGSVSGLVGQPRREGVRGKWSKKGLESVGNIDGLSRESKRKIAPLNSLEEGRAVSNPKSVGNISVSSPKLYGLENGDKQSRQIVLGSKPSQQASVKAKKVLARARVIANVSSSVGIFEPQIADTPCLFTSPFDQVTSDGRSDQQVPFKFQLPSSEVASESMAIRMAADRGMEEGGELMVEGFVDGVGAEGGLDGGLGSFNPKSINPDSLGRESVGGTVGAKKVGGAISIHHHHGEQSHVKNYKGAAIHRDVRLSSDEGIVEASGMEVEGGGNPSTSC